MERAVQRHSWVSLVRKIGSWLGIGRNWDCLDEIRYRFSARKAGLFRQLNQVDHPTHFSILLSCNQNQDPALIKSSIASLSSQVYSSWDLYLAGDAGQAYANWFKAQHLPISVSADENECLQVLKGEFVIPLGAGDRLTRVALAELAVYLDNFQDLDLVYSDEDRINRGGRRSHALCKPDWSPDYLLSHNYIGRLVAYRKEKLLLAGGFSTNSDISDDYGLTLRFTRLTQMVGHIPHVLYSRHVDASLADPEKVRITLEDELQYRNWRARVEPIPAHPGIYATHWDVVHTPLISIIICTQDQPDLLNSCLGSIFTKSTYANFEVVLVDNGSRQQETQTVIQTWKDRKPTHFRDIRFEDPFNFSLLNNRAADQVKGELLLFLNNDTEVVSQDWLEEMAGQAQREHTGAVGALLTFPDQRIQHAGILVGGKGLAIHAYRGLLNNLTNLPNRLVVPSNFPALTGACLMIRKDLFISMGGFNEDLAISYGDVDLCMRLKSAGYNNILLPFVNLMHHESATRGYEVTREKRNRLQAEARILQELWPELKESHDILTA
jgi:GT2 family glycosyltransferase